MPRVCTVCTHPERRAIDSALIEGTSLRDIARRFAVGKDAVARHRAEHLPQALLAVKETEDVAHALDVIQQLKTINNVGIAILAEARAAKDGDLSLKAIDRIHRQIELQAKLLGDLDERPVVNVLVRPEWLALRERIVAALAPYPEARLALAAVLDAD